MRPSKRLSTWARLSAVRSLTPPLPRLLSRPGEWLRSGAASVASACHWALSQDRSSLVASAVKSPSQATAQLPDGSSRPARRDTRCGRHTTSACAQSGVSGPSAPSPSAVDRAAPAAAQFTGLGDPRKCRSASALATRTSRSSAACRRSAASRRICCRAAAWPCRGTPEPDLGPRHDGAFERDQLTLSVSTHAFSPTIREATGCDHRPSCASAAVAPAART